MGAMATYQLDPAHSTVGFSVKHLMITNVRGVFEKYSGKFVYDSAKPEEAQVEATIETGSVNTHVADRDKHLRNADFFDAEKFPTMTFKSNSVKAVGGGRLQIAGDLTLHGVTKPVVVHAEKPSDEWTDPYKKRKIGLSAETKISRKDFGLTWNVPLEGTGVLVGDDVRILLDLQFVRE